MIFDARLPTSYWGYAVQTAAYLKHRTPSECTQRLSPYELLYKQKPDLKNLKVFGCTAYAFVPKSQRRKMDKCSTKSIFVGYSNMGYRLLNLSNNRITVSRDIVFDETRKESTYTPSCFDGCH